ncbi:MAG TPA: VTT domain-containing protein [Thermoleophilaceae bacterium]|nr:VTT domain-containing protein [Thermoleophilaceae bacterium]
MAVDAESRQLRRRALLRVAAAAAAMLCAFAAARLAGFSPSADGIRDWVDGLGAAGPFLFVLAGVVLNCLWVPLPVIAGAGGLVFGTAAGAVLGVLVTATAATVQLLIGRRLAGERAELLLGERGSVAAEFVARRGFWTVLYVRLVPALPFNMLNYAAGLSRVRARAVFAGTGLGFAPRMFAYAAVGGNLSRLDSPEALVAIAVGVATAVVGAVLARRQIAAERRR